MSSFQQRSNQKELLDGTGIPFPAIRRNMQELDTINRLLGGHRVTLKGMRRLMSKASGPLHIVEIGCGGGDNLRVIRDWARQQQYKVTLTGIDSNAECIAYARSSSRNRNIDFIHSDYREGLSENSADVIFSSLFCHHFTDGELVAQLRWMAAHSRVGFFINDLHRHPAAYYSIRTLTRLFSRSYLVKNDAPLSVRRGFIKQDWYRILQEAGLAGQLSWQWAFRWLVVYLHEC